MVLVQKIVEEKPKILSRKPRNAKNLVKKSKRIQEMPRICQEIWENPRIGGKKEDIIG